MSIRGHDPRGVGSGKGHAMDRPSTLTPRELEVCRLTAEGYTDTEIGERLGSSRTTVKRQTQSVREKLGARNQVQMVALLIRRGDL